MSRTSTAEVNQSVDLDPLYSYREVAKLVGVSERQVRRWVDEGRLGFVGLPRGRRVARSQYIAFINARRVEASDA